MFWKCFEFCLLGGLQILGLEEGVADLKIIHVAGTKGKVSSWCEFVLQVDAFLAACSSFSLSVCVCGMLMRIVVFRARRVRFVSPFCENVAFALGFSLLRI